MRIASNQYAATMNTALQTANAGLARVTSQMASGSRILKPSDDTIATVRLARLTREQSALNQYRDNIGALGTRLDTNEVTLGSMKDDLMMVRDQMVWAADGSNTPDDLKAMASSLESLRDSLLYSSNARNAEGKYLFSGTATDIPTVAYDGTQPPGARYSQGVGVNSATQDVAVADGVTVAANIPMAAYNVPAFLNSLDQAIDAFKNGTYTNTTAANQITSVDTLLNSVAGQISVLGGRQNVLQTLDGNHASVGLSNEQSERELGQLDYAEASVRLNSYTLAVQATQKAYAKVSNLSLFDVI
ncbi:MAG: flagellar hook-associated protein FlgL [Burkholderiaceae bacterium]